MFGPGTHCRCATCTELPLQCTWGEGPYAGTVLLYAQVIPVQFRGALYFAAFLSSIYKVVI